MQAYAVITTKWNKAGYKALSVDRVISFDVDSAMDTDADQWTCQLGDPFNDIKEVLKRDNEVRVDLVLVQGGKIRTLHRGYADTVSKNEEGIIEMVGRDITAPAVDATALPFMHTNVRIDQMIHKESRALGMAANLKLLKHQRVKKFYTDGTETYWEKWYRFYRKFAKAYIWAEPDGTIYADRLSYHNQPTYYFGQPRVFKGHQRQWIPVEQMEWNKNTQTRVGEQWVSWQKGNTGSYVRERDPSIRLWSKKPVKFVTSKQARNEKQARAEAWEEIFEGKVGSLEIKITCFDPGFLIRQNRIAVVNLPKLGLVGTFYIVGVRHVVSPDGLFQEVRLRERGFALTKRVPDDPQLQSPDHEPAAGTDAVLSDELTGIRWADCFVKAAHTWHKQYGFQVFLSVLLGIAKHEEAFRNGAEEAYDHNHNYVGGKDWHMPPSVFQKEQYDKWRWMYADGPRDNHNPFSPAAGLSTARPGAPERGVGPMQLTDASLKQEADRYAVKHKLKLPGTSISPNNNNSYTGGRWCPCANIWVAAHSLYNRNPHAKGTEADLRDAIWSYAGRSKTGLANANSIWKMAQDFLPTIQAAAKASKKSKSPADASEPGGHGGTQYYFDFYVGHQFLGPDQGLDFAVSEGDPVYAHGRAKILYVARNVWPNGGVYIAYKLLDGPYAGWSIYVAEMIKNIQVAPGKIVQKGQLIARFRSGSMETGWHSGGINDSPKCRLAFYTPVGGMYGGRGSGSTCSDSFARFLNKTHKQGQKDWPVVRGSKR